MEYFILQTLLLHLVEHFSNLNNPFQLIYIYTYITNILNFQEIRKQRRLKVLSENVQKSISELTIIQLQK